MEQLKQEGGRVWQKNFHWQKFFSKGIWQKRAEEYMAKLEQSDLPDVVKQIDAQRFEARRDSFARRLYNVTPWEPRLKVDKLDFLASRAFFAGVPLVPPHEEALIDGEAQQVLAQPLCHIINLSNEQCRRPSDCFGHHAFLCPCTSKQTEHNVFRDVIDKGVKSMGYIAQKEVPVAQWKHRADNEIVDIAGDDTTTWLDVTVRALVQESLLPLEQLTKNATQEKRRAYPVKNAEGRHVVQGNFIPFVMSSMGSLGKDGHKFLKQLRKKNSKGTDHLMDVLVVQHAKWIAKRLNRSLGHYNQPFANVSSRKHKTFPKEKNPKRGRLLKFHEGVREPASARGPATTSQRPRRSKPAAAKAAPGAASAAVSHRAAQSTGAEGRALQSCDTERSLDESSTSTHPRVFESSADVASNSVLQPVHSEMSEVFPVKKSPTSGSRQCCRSLRRKCIQLRKLCSQHHFRLVKPIFSKSFFYYVYIFILCTFIFFLFLFKYMSNIFFILFSLPTSTQKKNRRATRT